MEELQSTEMLEREILEDARKKAMRILKAADDTILAKNAEWNKKTAETIYDLEEKYHEQKKLTTEKLMARLPIDKLRSRVEKIEYLLHNAVESWYKNLNKEQIINLLRGELLDRLSANGDFSSSAEKKAYYSAIDGKDAETVLKSVSEKFIIEEKISADHYPSIILETENARIIASIQNIIEHYLQEKREELIEAMMGRGFLEDA